MIEFDFETYTELIDALVHKLSNIFITYENIQNCYYISTNYDNVFRSNIFGYKVVTINDSVISESWNNFFGKNIYGNSSIPLVYENNDVNENYDELLKHHFVLSYSKIPSGGLVTNEIQLSYQYNNTIPVNNVFEIVWSRKFISPVK